MSKKQIYLFIAGGLVGASPALAHRFGLWVLIPGAVLLLSMIVILVCDFREMRRGKNRQYVPCTLLRVYAGPLGRDVAEFFDHRTRGILSFSEESLMERIRNGEKYAINVSQEYEALAIMELRKEGITEGPAVEVRHG